MPKIEDLKIRKLDYQTYLSDRSVQFEHDPERTRKASPESIKSQSQIIYSILLKQASRVVVQPYITVPQGAATCRRCVGEAKTRCGSRDK